MRNELAPPGRQDRGGGADCLTEIIAIGELAEWLNAHASKACYLERGTKVRILHSPPLIRQVVYALILITSVEEGFEANFRRRIEGKGLWPTASKLATQASTVSRSSQVLSRPP